MKAQAHVCVPVLLQELLFVFFLPQLGLSHVGMSSGMLRSVYVGSKFIISQMKSCCA